MTLHFTVQHLNDATRSVGLVWACDPQLMSLLLPGTDEFDGDAAGPEPAQGWADLIQECWATTPEQRPPFRDIVPRLEDMLRANKMARRRTASGPAAATGTAGVM